MKYCSNCGCEVQDGVRYCQNCGTEVINNGEHIERKQVFAGQIVKCPKCGEEINNSYVTICPSCGFELKSSSTANVLDEFKKKINEYDNKIGSEVSGYSTWSTGKKIGFILLCIYTVGIAYLIYNSKQKKKNSPNQKLLLEEKKNYIEQYSFPNDRESLLDVLIFFKERLYSLTTGTVKGEDMSWAQIWWNKTGHVYQKIQMLYPNDKNAEETYKKAENYFNKIKKLKLKRTLTIIAVVALVVIFSYVYTYLTTGSFTPAK